jgi:hypothetical protein
VRHALDKQQCICALLIGLCGCDQYCRARGWELGLSLGSGVDYQVCDAQDEQQFVCVLLINVCGCDHTAERVAGELGVTLGSTVGYQVCTVQSNQNNIGVLVFGGACCDQHCGARGWGAGSDPGPYSWLAGVCNAVLLLGYQGV